MNCQKCNSKRILDIQGRCADQFIMWCNQKEFEGYVPSEIGISTDSDFIEFKYCLDCGQIQSNFPISEEAVDDAFAEFDDEVDEESTYGEYKKFNN